MRIDNWSLWVKGEVDGDLRRIRLAADDPEVQELLTRLATKDAGEPVTLGEEKPGQEG